MLFRKNMEPSCSYCRHGITLAGLNEVVCRRRGIMLNDGMCGAFRYEPTKRKPEYSRFKATVEYSPEEMSL